MELQQQGGGLRTGLYCKWSDFWNNHILSQGNEFISLTSLSVSRFNLQDLSSLTVESGDTQ
jgi:hypothetical protein